MDSRIAHIENVYKGARGGYRGRGTRGGGRIRGGGRGAYRRGRAPPEGVPRNVASAQAGDHGNNWGDARGDNFSADAQDAPRWNAP